MSQMVFSICVNPEEVGCKASEGMDLLAKQRRQEGKDTIFFNFLTLDAVRFS